MSVSSQVLRVMSNMPEPDKKLLKQTESMLKSYNFISARLIADKKSVEKLKKINLTRNLYCDKISALEDSIALCELQIENIDSALEQIKDDFYFSIIPLKYFKLKSECTISFKLNCDVSTVYRNKNRLLKMLCCYFYADEVF